MAAQAAAGVSHLHSRKIVHRYVTRWRDKHVALPSSTPCACGSVSPRDIAARNVLVDDHLNVRVADFGLSRLITTGTRGSELDGTPQGETATAVSVAPSPSACSARRGSRAAGVVVPTLQIGPVRWEAPEVLNSPRGHKVFSFASDVFSFGVLLYEVVSGGARPWGDAMSDLRVAGEVAHGGSLASHLPKVGGGGLPAPQSIVAHA